MNWKQVYYKPAEAASQTPPTQIKQPTNPPPSSQTEAQITEPPTGGRELHAFIWREELNTPTEGEQLHM